MLDFTR